MKKFLLLTSLIIFTHTFVNAQDSIKTELTKETIYKDVKQVLAQMGEALKVGAEHVYEVLVKQQIVESVIFITLLIGGFLILFWGMKIYKNIKWNRDYEYDKLENPSDIVPFIVSITFIIVGGLLVLIGIGNIDDIVTGFINPEYGAIKEIMKMIK